MSEACTLINIKLTSISYCCPRVIMSHETPYPGLGGRFTDVSRALQNIISKYVSCKNRTFYGNFKLKLCMCALGHTCEISAWNFNYKCDFWHCIFSRGYFEELAKCKWNNPQSSVSWLLSSMHISFVMEDQPQIGLLCSWIIPKQISPPAQTTELQYYLYVSHGNYQGQETWFQ